MGRNPVRSKNRPAPTRRTRLKVKADTFDPLELPISDPPPQFLLPRAGWAEAFEQFGIPTGHTGPAEEMFESVNAGWMDLGITGTEHVAGTTSARDVFAAVQNAVKA